MLAAHQLLVSRFLVANLAEAKDSAEQLERLQAVGVESF